MKSQYLGWGIGIGIVALLGWAGYSTYQTMQNNQIAAKATAIRHADCRAFQTAFGTQLDGIDQLFMNILKKRVTAGEALQLADGLERQLPTISQVQMKNPYLKQEYGKLVVNLQSFLRDLRAWANQANTGAGYWEFRQQQGKEHTFDGQSELNAIRFFCDDRYYNFTRKLYPELDRDPIKVMNDPTPLIQKLRRSPMNP